MKTSKLVVLFTLISLVTSTMVNAQTEEKKEQVVNIPENYQQIQQQSETDTSVGTATYNIVENETQVDPQSDPGAATWTNEEDVEILRVYSGSQDGNNVVKTIEVKKIPNSPGSLSEYVPK
ncbi:MAG TPA: hypothetical protein PKD91_16450 [Bacteroidia bacterium]|nr:hypothetical protein [Bacteroidia bacterium]